MNIENGETLKPVKKKSSKTCKLNYLDEGVENVFVHLDTRYLLYTAHSLSSWGDRMWSFAVAIYFITLNDGNLQMVALNGLVINIAVILFASIIGDWVDKTPRIGAVRKALYVQNLSVALMAGIVVFALLYKSHLEIVWKGYFLLFIQVLLIFLGVFATLASIASKVAISKDWIVAIYGHNQQKLALTNAAMRRIDLLTNVLAPLVAGGIMAFISRWASALLISSWNVISLFIELYLYTKVYKSAESILSNKIIEKKSIRMKPFTQLITSVKGFKTYYKMSTMYPGLALALLYFTVLSFDSVTNAFVIKQGLSEFFYGGFNGIGSLMGVLGTICYPLLIKRIGLVRTGIVGFWCEYACLLLCLASLFVPGTVFHPFKYKSFALCPVNNKNDTLKLVSNETSTILTTIVCSKSSLSVLLLTIGITFNRFGLWIADLTVNQLQQECVPADVRGLVGGTQWSLNQFFDMLRYILLICLPLMEQFGYHVILSTFSVLTASILYTIWSFTAKAKILVNPAEEMMIEYNIKLFDGQTDTRQISNDLSNYYETKTGEKIKYVDEEY